MLTALSVARDCNMIHDGEKVIVIEASEQNILPKFTFAQIDNRHGNKIRYDLSVCIITYILLQFQIRIPVTHVTLIVGVHSNIDYFSCVACTVVPI